MEKGVRRVGRVGRREGEVEAWLEKDGVALEGVDDLLDRGSLLALVRPTLHQQIHPDTRLKIK